VYTRSNEFGEEVHPYLQAELARFQLGLALFQELEQHFSIFSGPIFDYESNTYKQGRNDSTFFQLCSLIVYQKT
jgi:hypothetical protein